MSETPQDVPARPAYVLRVRKDPDGTETAWLDGVQVTVPPGIRVHHALIKAARERADREHLGTVRVAGITSDGTTFHLAIGPDGKAREADPPKDPVNERPATAVNAFRPATRTRATTQLTDDLGRPIPVTTTQVSSHTGYAAPASPDAEHWVKAGVAESGPAAPPVKPGEHGADSLGPAGNDDSTGGRGPSRRAFLLGGAGVAALAAAGTALFVSTRGRDAAPTPAPTGTPMPVGIRPPAGLPASYLWSIVKLAAVTPQVVATESQLVCTVHNDTTGGTQLLSLDAKSGKTQWKADIPVDAVVADGPALCSIAGVNSIVLTTQSQIISYPLTGGEAKTWPVDRNWRTAITDSGVIVTKPADGASAFVLHDDQLLRRALPRGSSPVAMLADGALVAMDVHGRVWLVTDATKTPKPTLLQPPTGTAQGTFVAATPTLLIAAFAPDKQPKSSLLRAFSLPNLQPTVTTATISPAVSPGNFMLAPGATWAVAGNTWVDLTTGNSHVISAGWSPIAISSHNSWSKSGNDILTADARGKSLGAAQGSSGQVAVPCGGTNELAFCVATVGRDTTMYAVPVPA